MILGGGGGTMGGGGIRQGSGITHENFNYDKLICAKLNLKCSN